MGYAMPGQRLLLSTCHIHWDPKDSDIKMMQTMMLTNELTRIATQYKSDLNPSGLPLLLLGDFNSLPSSGVEQFISSGAVSYKDEEFRGADYVQSLRKLDFLKETEEGVFSHKFKLKSAYNSSILPYSNYTFDFTGLIDHIFYSEDSMRPLGLLGAVDLDWITSNEIKGFPHVHVPSDHLPLMLQIELKPTSSLRTGSAHP